MDNMIFELKKHYKDTVSHTSIISVEPPFYQLHVKADYTKIYYDETRNNYVITDLHDHLLNFIHFQNTAVKEGISGLFLEDLLHIIKCRIDYMQHNKIPCIENVKVLNCINEALYHLRCRTNDRIARNVIGTNNV